MVVVVSCWSACSHWQFDQPAMVVWSDVMWSITVRYHCLQILSGYQDSFINGIHYLFSAVHIKRQSYAVQYTSSSCITRVRVLFARY